MQTYILQVYQYDTIVMGHPSMVDIGYLSMVLMVDLLHHRSPPIFEGPTYGLPAYPKLDLYHQRKQSQKKH